MRRTNSNLSCGVFAAANVWLGSSLTHFSVFLGSVSLLQATGHRFEAAGRGCFANGPSSALFANMPNFFRGGSSILRLSARLLCKVRRKWQVFISRAIDIDVNE